MLDENRIAPPPYWLMMALADLDKPEAQAASPANLRRAREVLGMIEGEWVGLPWVDVDNEGSILIAWYLNIAQARKSIHLTIRAGRVEISRYSNERRVPIAAGSYAKGTAATLRELVAWMYGVNTNAASAADLKREIGEDRA